MTRTAARILFALALALAPLLSCARPAPRPTYGPPVGPWQGDERLPRCLPAPPHNLTEHERQTFKPLRAEGGFKRLCEVYPALGKAIDPEAGEYEICVHPEGYVYEVNVLQPTSYSELDKAFGIFARRWRYEPHVKDGVAVPFCHPLRVVWRTEMPRSGDGR